MDAEIEQAKFEYENKVRVMKVEALKQAEKAIRFGIIGIK